MPGSKSKANYDKFAASKKNARFKGIENFLRRVAFNLGNTPSQTEVKIISCIPVDVTDLQQKIVVLEKQLAENMIEHQQKRSNLTVNTAAVCPCSLSREKNCCSKARKSSVSFDCPSDPDSCTSQYEQAKRFEKQQKRNKKLAVYYAQVSDSPFKINKPKLNSHKMYPRKSVKGVSRSYIEDIIKKQYKTRHMPDLSVDSQFSKPRCRDSDVSRHQIVNHGLRLPSRYYAGYDINDNFTTEFINIDNNSFATKHHFRQKSYPITNIVDSENIFYDSNLYDIVPVKEKPKKNPQMSKVEKVLNTMCSSECTRPSQRQCEEYVVNCHTLSHNNRQSKPSYTSQNKKNKRYNTEKPYPMLSKKIIEDQHLSVDCSVDCSDIYRKQSKTPSQLSTVTKHPECRTIFVNCAECQASVDATPSMQTNETKAEATLNQIKDILRNVLLEVKTTQMKSDLEKLPNREVPTNEKSNTNNLNEARNFYGPQNMNTCSRNMSSGPFYQYGFPYPTIGYPQTFPLIIQSATQGRHLYTSCHQHCNCKQQVETKNATTTSVDEVKEKCSSETEKLIKEIYKSINMDVSNKDTTWTNTQNESTKSCVNYTVNTANINRPNSKENIQEAIPDIKDDFEIPLNDKAELTSEIQSEINELDQIRKKNYEEFVKNNTFNGNESRYIPEDMIASRELTENIEGTEHEDEPADDDDIEETGEDIEASESEIESSSVITEIYQKNKKKSIFRRVLSSLFKSNKKGHTTYSEPAEEEIEEEIIVEDSEAGDTEDYQTIYSEQVDRSPKGIFFQTIPKRKQAYAKNVLYKNDPDLWEARPTARLPHMEQDLRGQWHDQQRYYGRQPYFTGPPTAQEVQPSGRYQHPMYWQTYETRNAFVDYPPPTNMVNGAVQADVQIKPDRISKKQYSSNQCKFEPLFKQKWSLFNKSKNVAKPRQGWKKFFLES